MTDTQPKRPLFTKPSSAFTKPPSSRSKSHDIFGKNDIYADILAAKEKRRAERAAKEKAKAERAGRESKRQRLSDEHEDDDNNEDSDIRSHENVGNEEAVSLGREEVDAVEVKRLSTRSTPQKDEAVTALDTNPSPRTRSTPKAAKDAMVIELDGDHDKENDDDDLYGTVQKISPAKTTKPPPKPTLSDSASEDEDEDEYTKKLKERAREKARLRKVGVDVGQAKSPTGVATDSSFSLSPAPPNDPAQSHQAKSPQDAVTPLRELTKAPTAHATADDPPVSILIKTIIPKAKPLIINRRASSPLHAVRMFWCKAQNFDTVQTARVFLTWRGIRLYDTSTMTGILKLIKAQRPYEAGDPSQGKIELEAMTEEIMQHRQRQKAQALENEFGTPDPLPNLDDEAQATRDAQDPPETRFVIRLQAQGLQEMILKVRPSTTIAKIMSGFKKMRQVDESKTCWLIFDGDRLEPESKVGDTEIEGGDVLEVLVR